MIDSTKPRWWNMLIESATKLGDWLKQRPLARAIVTALVGGLLGTAAPWIISDVRAPAPNLMPAEQKKLDDAAKAAQVVTDIFGE